MERDPGALVGEVARRGGWAATALLGGGALVAFVVLRRYTAHGNDVFTLMRWLDEGVVHPQHPLYLAIAGLLRRLLQPFGLDTMTVLAVFSALGGALGVVGVHRAALALGGERVRAAWSAATVAALPGVVFFATIGELQAPFFGGVGLAAWAVATWLRVGDGGVRGDVRRASCVGVVTAVVTLLHATGHLLVPLGASVWLGVAMRRGGRSGSAGRVLAVAALGTAHAAVYLTGVLALRATGTVLHGDPASFLAERAEVAQWIGFVPRAIVTQWLLPFAPVSVLAWLAARRSPQRGLWLFGVAVGYLLVGTALAHGADEVGGYLLPLAVPAALLTFDAVPRRWWPLVFALAVAATALHRALRPQLAPDFELATAVAAAPRPTVWVVGDEAESWGARWLCPQVELVEPWVAMVEVAQRTGRRAEELDAATLVAWLELSAVPALAAGKHFVVTAHAVEVLSARLPAFTAAWRSFTGAHHSAPSAMGTRVW